MRIVLGKNVVSGVPGCDSADNNAYTELGFEMMGFRPILFRMLKENKISVTDTIVTLPDRFFLYSKVFTHLEPFQSNTNYELDLVNLFQRTDPSHPHVCTKELMSEINYCDLSSFNTNNNFICMQIRTRDLNATKNMSLNYCSELIRSLQDRGQIVYLFGMGIESFSQSVGCVHLNLQEWASLMHHPNCKAIVGQHSGAMQVGQICYNGDKMIIIDQSDYATLRPEGHIDHPLMFGKCVQYSNSTPKIINHLPSIEDLVCMILS